MSRHRLEPIPPRRALAAVFATGLAVAALLGGCRDHSSSGGTTVGVAPNEPLSGLVALVLPANPSTASIPALVRSRVDAVARATLPSTVTFPLPNAAAGDVRALPELAVSIPVKWLDPITPDGSVNAPRYGSNNDYFAFFGDGWDSDWQGDVVNSPPQWSGDGSRGWAWINHEHIGGFPPGPTNAPIGPHLTLAKLLQAGGVLTNDVTAQQWSLADIDTHLRYVKRQLGGSWLRLERTGDTWRAVPSVGATRYDATSATRLRITGHSFVGLDHTDDGQPLPAGVASGIMADCSGCQTPWGTILTAEENVQDFYGDLENGWAPNQRRLGYDPGAVIQFTVVPSLSGLFGRMTDPNGRHDRDLYGWLSEIDPGQPADRTYESAVANGSGRGHRKIGGMGRARWENATIAVGADWRLFDGQPIVAYAGDDRRSGRIFKFVTRNAYRRGMTRADTRALLDDGTLYVAHFAGLDNRDGVTLLATGQPPSEAQPGAGRWVRLDCASPDVTPNASALGMPTKTVGSALTDVNWNGMGGFANDDAVRMALFTAANKVGIMELNRPEDLEWNPRDPSGRARLYVALTGHGTQVALDQDGILFDPNEHAARAPNRSDRLGSIFAIEEETSANPGASVRFTYRIAFRGSAGRGVLDAAAPDNLLVDRDGGVWFTTDGNAGVNGDADAVYYLDLDPTRRAGQPGIVVPTYGKAFRIATAPSGAETTGPGLTPEMTTLFFNAQHPIGAWPPR